MDLTTNTTTRNRIPDTESQTPPQQSQPIINPLSFTNGKLKTHHHNKKHHPPPPPPAAVYKECLKNHAASIGGHAVDGCGEFMPSPTSTPTQPTSLKCAACGCHRNFHRRELNAPPPAATHFHHSPSSSPPANYMLLSLTTAAAAEDRHHSNHQHAVATPGTPTEENPSGRKRFRTKFSQEQKERMSSFAEKVGWKMQRCDDGMVEEFCSEIGIRRGILKVWMHNNKNTFGKREKNNSMISNGRVSFENNNVNGSCHNINISTNNNDDNSSDHGNGSGDDGGGVHLQVSTNGSSSSS